MNFFFSVIDTHNHFRPFSGPAVPFDTYFQWMADAGILFSTVLGIGQQIKKKNHDGMSTFFLKKYIFEAFSNLPNFQDLLN